MSVETLENLLKNPDIWDISLSTQNMHDVLVEIASRVDSLMLGQEKIKPINNDKEEQTIDVTDFTSRIDALSKQLERQNTDFGSEIQDLRALFNFQLRDIREKMDRNINNIKDSMSRPSSPPATVIQQIPDNDSNFETERKLHSLSKDITHIKEKVRAILNVLKDLPEIQNKMIENEENKNAANSANKTDENPTSDNKISIDGEPDVDLTSQTSNINQDDPLSTTEDDPFSTSRIKDSRFDDIIEDIEFMKKERKNDTERLNSTIKAVNQLIAEKDNSTNKINQCVRDTKRFNDEFDRLYQKMAEFQLEVDKKISEALNIRINNDIKSVSSPSNNQPLELPSFKEGISDDLANIDNNYKQQINYLKLEISQLKQALSDRMMLPSFGTNSNNSRVNVEVQTDESITDGIPTRHANVDVQKTRVANEIMTQVIVSRTPIQYMAINQDYINMLKKVQVQSPEQQPAEKPKPVKRQRRPVSTSSIEIQTNEKNSKDQPDVNPPNDDEPDNRSSSSSKAGSSYKRMRSSHSNRKVTYIDSTTETQAEISGIGSPLRTPPRTPLRSQNQKRKAVLIDILIETDPEITGEPLGITPDLLEDDPNRKKQNESDSEEETEKEENNKNSQDQSKPKSPLKVDTETTSVDENADNSKKKKKKRKKSKKGSDLQTTQDDSQNQENLDESQQDEDQTSPEDAKIDNVGTEVKSKVRTPIQKSDTTKENKEDQQKETENKNETDQSLKSEQNKQQKESESEAQSKDSTPQTSQKVSRTETPNEPEQQEQSKTKTNVIIDKSEPPITTNKNAKRKKEKVIYADSGISMQINTYEKEIKERNDQDDETEEVEVVDIEIQTDEISEEELSMYSIFNQESNPDLLKDMGDMTYMERYSTSGANTNIGYGNQNYQTKPQRPTISSSYSPQQFYFSFEHLLSLTIISEIKPPEPQTIITDAPKQTDSISPTKTTPTPATTTPTSNTKTPVKSDISNADIQSIVNKTLENHKDINYDALTENVNEHTKQISNIFNILNDMKNMKIPTFVNINDSEQSATGNSTENKDQTSSNGSRVGTGINNNNPQISQSQQEQEQIQQQQQQQQLHQQPGFTPSNPIVIADLIPDATPKFAQVPPDLIERLDQFDDSIADLEDHIFSLEKKLINKGALRPNSANPYGDDYSASPFGPKINTENTSNNNKEAYREPSYYRHHHHHHRHGSSNKNNEPNTNEYENPNENNDNQNANENIENNNEIQQATNQTQQEKTIENENTNQNQQQQQQSQQPQQNQTSPNHVVAIASGPDKPRSSYYNQFTPGSLSKERNQNAKKESLEFIQGFTIDPDPEAMKPVEKEVVIPEDLTIPKYERQLRLLREAVVELRTNIQILRVKTDQPVIIQPTENVEAEPEEKNENTVDEQTFRALRKKIELTFDDYSSQIADIRRELYLHLEQPPDRIIEVRTEVQTVEKPKDDNENDKKDKKPAPAAPKDINVDLNLSKAIEMLADTQHKSVISINKIEIPPEVKEHRDLAQRLQNNNPIIENNHQPGAFKPSSDLLQPPPASDGTNNANQRQEENEQQIDYSALPPPASTPLVTGVKNEGHFVPQIVQDMRVLNAMPKKDMLELLMPFLYQLRSELLMNIDSNTERIRCLENSVQMKVEKDFIESFFRKIRMAVKEADDKAMRACNSLFDKVSKQDLEDRVQELLKQIGTQETTVAGKTSYTCLFCGTKKTSISKSSVDKGKLFKGRTTRQSLQPNELSQLPPLNENE